MNTGMMYVKCIIIMTKIFSICTNVYRYSLSNASAGFETHPEETPYDIEVKYLYKDIKKQQERDARLLESTKQMNSEINFFSSQVLDNSDGDESDDDNCSTSSSFSVQVISNKDHERLVKKKQQIDPLEANETDHEVALNPKRLKDDSGNCKADKKRKNFDKKKGGNEKEDSYSERQEAKDRVALRHQQLINDGLKLQAEIAASNATLKATEERMLLYNHRLGNL